MNWRSPRLAWAAAVLAVVAAGFLGGGALLPVWVYVGALAPALVGVALLTSYSGQLTLGQGGLVGVGAYAAANLAGRWDWPPVLAMAGSVVITVVVASLASPILRLRGLTFGLATLAVGEIIAQLATSLVDVTGGPSGFTNSGHRIPHFSAFGFTFDTIRQRLWLAWGVALAVVWLGRNIVRSRFGGSLVAVAADEDIASSLGVPVFTTKVRVWLLAAALAGVSGSLLVFINRFASPDLYGLDLSVLLIVGAVVGGARSIAAAIIATLILESAAEVIPGLSGYSLIVSAVLLVVVLLAAPDGLAGLAHRWLGRPAAPFDETALAGVGGAASGGAAVHEAMRSSPASREAVLDAVGVSVRFGGLRAVEDAAISVSPGEIVGLIGPNGAGKSTFVNALTGFVPIETGAVQLGRVDATSLSSHRRVAAGMRRTFQNARLVDAATVEANVALGGYSLGHSGLLAGMLQLPIARREQHTIAVATSEALDRVGLRSYGAVDADVLPSGLRRLVDVARASVTGPVVMLLDEPAAGLNDIETARLEGVIRSFAAAGTAVVVIEHDLGLVMRLCDRLVVLAEGRVIAAGSPDDVQRDPAVREAYLGVVADVVG